MKKLAALSLTLMMTVPAFAEKVPLTLNILNEILSVDALPHARFYLSDKLKIERVSWAQNSSEVDSSISRVITKSVLKEQIGKGVRGKIVALEDYGNTLFVSFDQSCERKECAMEFHRLGSSLPYYSLSEVGSVEGMKITGLKIGRLFGDKKLHRGKFFYFAKTKRGRVDLLVDLSELQNITLKKVKHGGF